MTRSQSRTCAASSETRAVREGVATVVALHSTRAASADKLARFRKALDATELWNIACGRVGPKSPDQWIHTGSAHATDVARSLTNCSVLCHSASFTASNY